MLVCKPAPLKVQKKRHKPSEIRPNKLPAGRKCRQAHDVSVIIKSMIVNLERRDKGYRNRRIRISLRLCSRADFAIQARKLECGQQCIFSVAPPFVVKVESRRAGPRRKVFWMHLVNWYIALTEKEKE